MNQSDMITSDKEEQPTEFLERFGYRSYSGERTNRFRRIFDLIWFEVTSTWNRSTFGKVLLIIVLIINAFVIFVSSIIASIGGAAGNQSDAEIREGLNEFIATYLVFTDNLILPSTAEVGLDLSVSIGFLLITLFAISGSGLFSDDKNGNVTEVYLSRVRKSEYITGKIGAIVVYSNIFIMIPLLINGFLNAQSLSVNHFEYLNFYAGIILYSLITSLFLSLGILAFSISMEKRHYASLGFFVIYFILATFGGSLYLINPNNELFLLISPSTLLTLLAYIILGDMNLAINNFQLDTIVPLDLNDGTGLEYWHVLFTVFGVMLVLSLYLWYKIQKLTTEEL